MTDENIDWEQTFWYNFSAHAHQWWLAVMYVLIGVYCLDLSTRTTESWTWILLIYIAVSCVDNLFRTPVWTRTYYQGMD